MRAKLACLFSFVVLSSAFAAKPPPHYEFILIGTLPGGSFSSPLGLNNQNQVVGISEIGLGEYHAFLWQDGKMRDLGSPLGSVSVDINDAGQILGTFPGGYPGPLTAEMPAGYTMSNPGYLNNSGFVAGDLRGLESGDVTGFLYNGTTIRLLPPLIPNGQSDALGINNRAQVIGIAQANQSDYHPVVWTGNEVLDLNTVPGVRMDQPSGINDFGHICGTGIIPLPGPDGAHTEAIHACLYRDNSVADLGVLPGMEYSIPFSINNSDDVVGHCQIQTTDETTAFLYTGGVMHDLERLTVQTRGWKIRWVLSINERGWIIGFAQKDFLTQAFVLRPLGPAGH
jgi:probable HAF family extracellular repeat protein